MEKTYYRRLPLDGLNNCRELGGYNVPGGVTKYGVCLRSEVPSALTDRDIEFLKNYGLTTVIDFRGGRETVKAPDVLASQPWVDYRHIPIFNEAVALGAGENPEKPPLPSLELEWKHHYVFMADECPQWVRDSLTAIADAPGVALFHCTTGKDRTGIISAMLLGICGVSDMDIIADYAVSEIYLRSMYMTMGHLIPPDAAGDLSHKFFSTAPDNMRGLLEHLENKYGGVVAYLRSCGLEDGVLSRLREKLAGSP